MRDVWIAVPAYTGQIHLCTARSILTDILELKAKGDSVMLFDESGNAMISLCRNIIIANFLNDPTATDLVFVDSDVIWEAGALTRLVYHPVDFVAGIYPHRADPLSFPVKWLDKPELRGDPETGLLEVAGVPAGFMRLSRVMLESMIASYPELEFPLVGDVPKAWALFEHMREGKGYLGEDYSFCRRWRDIGGKIWIDPEIHMGHVGYKTFGGHLGNYLRNR